MRTSLILVIPMAQRSETVLQKAMRPNMQGDSTNGQKKSRVETRVQGGTLMVETSGVSIPTGFGSLERQERSLFCGTLHPHPFILVQFVSTKSGLSPCSTGLKGFIAGGFPFLGQFSENRAAQRLVRLLEYLRSIIQSIPDIVHPHLYPVRLLNFSISNKSPSPTMLFQPFSTIISISAQNFDSDQQKVSNVLENIRSFDPHCPGELHQGPSSLLGSLQSIQFHLFLQFLPSSTVGGSRIQNLPSPQDRSEMQPVQTFPQRHFRRAGIRFSRFSGTRRRYGRVLRI